MSPDLSERITFDPNQCGGRPCFRSYRLRVTDVLAMLAKGATTDEILADYELFEPADINVRLQYAARQLDPSRSRAEKMASGRHHIIVLIGAGALLCANAAYAYCSPGPNYGNCVAEEQQAERQREEEQRRQEKQSEEQQRRQEVPVHRRAHRDPEPRRRLVARQPIALHRCHNPLTKIHRIGSGHARWPPAQQAA